MTPPSRYWLLQIFPDGLPNTMTADDKEDLMRMCAEYKFDDSSDDPPPQRIYPIEVLDSFCNPTTGGGTIASSSSSSAASSQQLTLEEVEEKMLEIVTKCKKKIEEIAAEGRRNTAFTQT